MTPDKEAAIQHLRDALLALGLDPQCDAELERTPERLCELLCDLTSGEHEPAPRMSTFTSSAISSKEPVLLCALPFHSLCVHHMLPFFGTLDIAYIPNEQLVGFGSITRQIEHFSRRPQIQERLVQQIADELLNQLAPHGVLVRCRARQMCMELRGAKKRGVLLSTAAYGVLTKGPQRDEIMAQFMREETAI